MAFETQNTKALEDLLKPHRQEVDILAKALKEVADEEAEKKIASAKEMLKKALELQKQMLDAERQWNTNKSKWDKELGKVIRRLQNMVANKPLDDGVEEENKEE